MFRMLTLVGVVFAMCGSVAGPAKGKGAGGLAHVLSGMQKESSMVLDDVASPYNVTADYIVDSGKELVVKPGVTLVFAKNAGITVRGALKLEGAAGSPIVCKGKVSGVGTWQGIKVCPKAKASIEWVSVSGAKVAFRLEEEVTIRKSNVSGNRTGIESESGAVTLEDCYVCENGGNAISTCGKLKMVHCTIAGNQGNGIYGRGDWNVQDSILKGNGNCGIDCTVGTVTAKNSAIAENKKFDVRNGCGLLWDCMCNYWGAAATRKLASKDGSFNRRLGCGGKGALLANKIGSANLPGIYDRRDNRQLGDVFISDWLDEMPAGCGAREYPVAPAKK